MNLALAENQITIWWVTIGLAFVVLLVVIILLTLLTGIVKDIDKNVTLVWAVATRVARNTTTSWLLGNTAGLSGSLRSEVQAHAELLEDKGGRR